MVTEAKKRKAPFKWQPPPEDIDIEGAEFKDVPDYDEPRITLTPEKALEQGLEIPPNTVLTIKGDQYEVTSLRPESFLQRSLYGKGLDPISTTTARGVTTTTEEFEKITEAFTAVFPDTDMPALRLQIEEDPERFLRDLQVAGRNEYTELLLRTALPDITEEQLSSIFDAQLTPEEIEGISIISEGHYIPTPEFLEGGTVTELQDYAFAQPSVTLETASGKEIEAFIQPDGSVWYQGQEIGRITPEGEFGRPHFEVMDFGRAIVAGFGDLLSGTASTLQWMSENSFGRELLKVPSSLVSFQSDDDFDTRLDEITGSMEKLGGKLQEIAPAYYGKFGPMSLLDARWWAAVPVRAAPYSLALLVPGLGLGYIGAAGGGLARTIISYVFGGTVMRATESAFEAGEAFNEAIRRGMSPEEAKEVGDKVFGLNMTLVGLDAAQVAAFFAPLPFPAKMAIWGLEGPEEAAQQVFQQMGMGEDIEWTTETWQAFAVGEILGLAMGGMASVYTNFFDNTRNAMSPELKTRFEELVAQNKAAGLEDFEAQSQALNVIAAEKEGETAITEGLEATKNQELLKQMKFESETEQIAWEHQLRPRFALAGTEEGVTPEGAKEPWQMTRVEFIKDTGIAVGAKELHQKAIQEAISEGKTIPAEVLAEYPEIAPAAPSEAAREPTEGVEEAIVPEGGWTAQSVKEAAIKGEVVPEGVSARFVNEATLGKLVRIIKEVKPVRAETEVLKHEELQKRVAKSAEILRAGEGMEAFQAAKGPLKGKLPKAEFEPPVLFMATEEVANLFNQIRNSNLRHFDKINTSDALITLMIDGQIPTEGQIQLLEDMFGPELASAILDKRGLGAKVMQEALEAANLPRAILASWDFSAVLRQAIILTLAHPGQTIPAAGAMFKAAFNEDNAVYIEESILDKPNHAVHVEAGVYVAPLRRVTPTVGSREEAYMISSRTIAGRIASLIPGVRISERAFITFLNRMRVDVFDMVYDGWVRDGVPITKKDIKDLGLYVNRATGRGGMGNIGDAAAILNIAFFSPRLQVARLTMPLSLFTSTPKVRQLVARDLAIFFGTGIAILALADLASDDFDVELDPRSADFGKVKIGNTRIDFWGGFQQYARYMAQFVTGQYQASSKESEVAETERGGVFLRFIRSKLSPIVSFLVDLITGETFIGEEMEATKAGVSKQARERLTPLFGQDLWDAIEDSGMLGGFIALPGAFGAGVITYPDVKEVLLEEEAKLGLPKDEMTDIAKELGAEEELFDLGDLSTIYGQRLRGVDPETITEENGYTPYQVAWADKEKGEPEYGSFPNAPLRNIEDFEKYYNQWQAIQKGEATIEEFPKAHLGNFDEDTLNRLKEYHRLFEKHEADEWLSYARSQGIKKSQGESHFIESYSDLKVNPREEWLKDNPRENALMTLFHDYNLRSVEAYDEMDKLVEELGIPENIIPEKMPKEIFVHDEVYDAMPSKGTGSATDRLKYRCDNLPYDKYGLEHGWFTVPACGQLKGGGRSSSGTGFSF